jgi:hypothetical protein
MIQVSGGDYRVNRRVTYSVGRGRVSFAKTGDDVRVIAPTLSEVPALRGFDDAALLSTSSASPRPCCASTAGSQTSTTSR